MTIPTLPIIDPVLGLLLSLKSACLLTSHFLKHFNLSFYLITSKVFVSHEAQIITFP